MSFNKLVFLIISIGLLVGCGQPKDGNDGATGPGGTDAFFQIIDPCGDDPDELDQVILQLSTGELLTSFERGHKGFLTLIENGDYTTTDKQECEFNVTDGVVTYPETL